MPELAPRWYYVQDGNKAGPLTRDELQVLAAAGAITPSVMVLREGETKWQAASSLPGLFVLDTPVAGVKATDTQAVHAPGDGATEPLHPRPTPAVPEVGPEQGKKAPLWRSFLGECWQIGAESAAQSARLASLLLSLRRERSLANHLCGAQARLGLRVYESGGGDESTRKAIADIDASISGAGGAGRTPRKLKNARDRVLGELGAKALQDTAPPSGAEFEFAETGKALAGLRDQQEVRLGQKSRLWPTTLAGWRRVALGHAAAVCLLIAAIVAAVPRSPSRPSKEDGPDPVAVNTEDRGQPPVFVPERPLLDDGKLTVAVLDFENTSADPNLQRLDRALQSMLTTDLATSRELVLIERARLQEILKELKLAKEGYVDPRTAAQVGKGVGARAILTGSFWVRDGRLRIDARMVHVESGKVLLAEEMTGNADEFDRLEKRLARKVLDTIGVRLSQFEMAGLERQHTKNLTAASQYGRALDLEDQGNIDAARRSVEEALLADPQFDLARKLSGQIDLLLAGVREATFLDRAAALARFEAALVDWEFEPPQHTLDNSVAMWKKGELKRALFHWISWLGDFENRTGQGAPPGLLFPLPEGIERDRVGIVKIYGILGGAEPVLFWCDVMTADPAYAPRKPLTTQQLNPNPLSLPLHGPHPSHYFHRYPEVLRMRYVTEAHLLGDVPRALESLQNRQSLCELLVSRTEYQEELERLQNLTKSQQALLEVQRKVREGQQRWRLAEEHVIDLLAYFQRQDFARPSPTPPGTPLGASRPDPAKERERLIVEFAPNILAFGGPAQSERGARQLVQELLRESGNAPFVGRKVPVFKEGTGKGGRPEFDVFTELHLAGCPWSRSTAQSKLAFGSPTTISPKEPNPLIPVQDPAKSLSDGWAPCPHCKPMRWVHSLTARQYLEKQLPECIEKFGKENDNVSRTKLPALLASFSSTPVKPLHPQVRSLAEAVCERNWANRGFNKKAFQAMAAVAGPEDVSFLDRLMRDSPFFDVRMCAAATLGAIGTPDAVRCIRNAEAREPYYFVRHYMRASLSRVREDHWQAEMTRIGELAAKGHLPKVREGLERALRMIAEDPEMARPTRREKLELVRYGLVGILSEQGETKQAIGHLRTLIREYPDVASYRNDLGYLLAQQDGDLKEAEQLLRSALELDRKQQQKSRPELEPSQLEDNPMYLDSLGYVLYKQKRYKEALELVTRAAGSKEGQLAEIYEHLGDIHLALGDRGLARKAWEKGASLPGNQPRDQRTRERIVIKLKGLG